MKKTAFIMLLAALLLIAIHSCSTAPTACFQVVTPADSIRAGYTVKFDGSCSNGASQYYWEFGNSQTSSSGPAAQIVYDTAGSYTVALVVGANGKSASATKTVVVH